MMSTWWRRIFAGIIFWFGLLFAVMAIVGIVELLSQHPESNPNFPGFPMAIINALISAVAGSIGLVLGWKLWKKV